MRLILESAAALHRKLRKKMAEISRQRQVLCITHLPQIAAMADAHFEIEKKCAGYNYRNENQKA